MKEIGNELTEQSLVIKVLDSMSAFLPKYTQIIKRRDNKNITCLVIFFYFIIQGLQLLIHGLSQIAKSISSNIVDKEDSGNNKVVGRDGIPKVYSIDYMISFGSEMISTKEFRKAQRYYGENLCGFSHPEYDYKKLVIIYDY